VDRRGSDVLVLDRKFTRHSTFGQAISSGNGIANE
jgi:hypothetical protein